jgi:hypothetical protein
VFSVPLELWCTMNMFVIYEARQWAEGNYFQQYLDLKGVGLNTWKIWTAVNTILQAATWNIPWSDQHYKPETFWMLHVCMYAIRACAHTRVHPSKHTMYFRAKSGHQNLEHFLLMTAQLIIILAFAQNIMLIDNNPKVWYGFQSHISKT